MHYNQILTKIQSLSFWKRPAFILALILSVFFLKGVFLAALFPLFVGQDETKHFNSIELLAEPRPITWPIKEIRNNDIEGLLKSNYTEEIAETAKAINFDEVIKGDLYNTPLFISGYEGENEAKIIESKWKQYNEKYPAANAGKSLYHRIASQLEKISAHNNIFVRYYVIRIFSVFLGMLTILFSYFIAKIIGLSPKSSLIITAIIAFQPRFSIYYSAINYDALLILLFTLFTLGGVLALKQGLNWKNLSLLIATIYLGILTKKTAAVLLLMLAILFAYFAYEKIKDKAAGKKYAICFLFILAFVPFSIFFKEHFVGAIPSSEGIFPSVVSYLEESIRIGRFALSSRTYWGALTWVNSWFLDNSTNIIWLIESISAAGLAIYFFAKKKLDFLPEKKYIAFLLGMIIVLQIGIRSADWLVFRNTGGLDLGTPGRYFLPNIAAHIILVFTGIGALLRKKEYFEKSLIVGLILMMTFMMYIIFDVIVYRYYL